MDVLILPAILLGFTFVIYYLYKILLFLNHSFDVKSFKEVNDCSAEMSEFTSYELEVMEREKEFDARINTLKDELNDFPHPPRRSHTAEILHPSISNLPHNTVKTKYDLYPIEFAE